MATTAAELSSTSSLDFSTTGQSMWGPGPALDLHKSFDIFNVSTGDLGFTAFDGDLSVSASLGAALVANFDSSSGAVDYPINAGFTMPNLVAPGQEFTVNTDANGLTSTPDFVPTFPTAITASLNLVFSGGFSVDFDNWLLGSFNLSQDFTHDIPLVSLGSNQEVDLFDGFLKIRLPSDYDETQPVEVGFGGVPPVSVEASTQSFIAANLPLIQTLVTIFFPEIKDVFPSGSFLDGAFEYTLAELELSAGIGFAQKFNFVPTGIDADISAPWGEEHQIPLGSSVTFTVPDVWSGTADLSADYVLHGNLVNQFGIVGNLDLDFTLLEGDLLGIRFGPLVDIHFPLASTDPLYLFSPGGSDGFAFDGFNTPTGNLAIALGTGLVDVPGGATIDTTAFTANSTAVIQTVLTDAAGGATQTNIYDPVIPSGSATAVAGELNVEVIDPAGPYQLPDGFAGGILEPGAGNAELDGTADSVLLAAAPGLGHTDILKSGGHETLVAGQDGSVKFVITSGFDGEIVGLKEDDTINLSDVPFDSSGTTSLGPNNVLTVNENGNSYTVQLHETEDFTGAGFALSADPVSGTDIGVVPPPPPPSAPELDAASDSGTVGDDITNVSAPVIVGTGQPGNTVTLFEGITSLGSDTVGGGGDWSITAPTLGDGDHNLTAVEKDPVGATSSPSTVLALIIDTTPPSAPTGLTLDPASDTGSQGDNLTSQPAPVINGKGEAGATVTLSDNSADLGTGVVADDRTWSITSDPLPPGPHSLTATQTDAAGNTSDPSGPLDLRIGPPPIGPSAPGQPFYFDLPGQYVLLTGGNDITWGNSDNSAIDGGSGDDFFGASGDNNFFNGGNGNDTVVALGDDNTLDGGKGADFLVAVGTGNEFDGGPGPDTIWGIGDDATVAGGQGDDVIGLTGTGGQLDGGPGNDTVYAFGGGNTATGGAGDDFIFLSGGHNTLSVPAGAGNDTVMGFDATQGDRIDLGIDDAAYAVGHSGPANGGLDTLITLSDGSTILLKFINHIDAGFFA